MSANSFGQEKVHKGIEGLCSRTADSHSARVVVFIIAFSVIVILACVGQFIVPEFRGIHAAMFPCASDMPWSTLVAHRISGGTLAGIIYLIIMVFFVAKECAAVNARLLFAVNLGTAFLAAICVLFLLVAMFLPLTKVGSSCSLEVLQRNAILMVHSGWTTASL